MLYMKAAACFRRLKKRAGEGMGAWGKNYKNAFPSERLGPLALAATGWRPQAVPVATKEATGIDSRDEGGPLPLNLNPQPISKIKCSKNALERFTFEKGENARRRHSAARPKVSGKTALFPRNDRPYGLERERFKLKML